MLAIQELAWKEASTIEHLVGELRDVVAKFDGVFSKVVPVDSRWPRSWSGSRARSTARRPRSCWAKPCSTRCSTTRESSRPLLDLLLSREDLPLEDWIDTDDPELVSLMAAVYDRIEDQLADKEIPHPAGALVMFRRCTAWRQGRQGRPQAARGEALTTRVLSRQPPWNPKPARASWAPACSAGNLRLRRGRRGRHEEVR